MTAPAPAATLDRHVRAFLDHLLYERGMSERTASAYGGDLERFAAFAAEYLGREPVKIAIVDLDPMTIRGFIAELALRRGVSRRSQGRALSALRTFFRWAAREGLIEANPAIHLQAPKAERTLARHLRPAEMELLLAAPTGDGPLVDRDRVILELLYASGLRVGELVSLDWSDLDLTGRVLRVVGKGDKERMVPFGRARGARALARRLGRGALRRQRTATRPRSRAAPRPGASAPRRRSRCCSTATADGSPTVRSVASSIAGWKRRRSRAGCIPHTLRHTFATHLLERGRRPALDPGAPRPQSRSAPHRSYTHLELGRLLQVYRDSHPAAARSVSSRKAER